jgi:hypothetical protein
MAVQGLVRLREHQFGRQTEFGNIESPTRAYPFQGVPSVDLAWTDPEIDAGSLDPVAAPFQGPSDLTASLTAPVVYYNDLPLMLSAFWGDEVVPSGGGTAKTWLYEPSSTTADILDHFTYQFGDDVLTDWYQLGDGILENLEFEGPEGLGPVTASMTWRFGSMASTGSTDRDEETGEGGVPVDPLDVDTAGTIVYLKDMGIYIADTVAGLGAGQVTDALHSFTLTFNQEIDQKRWANADQSFDVDAYGRGLRTVELACTFAKTADTVGIGSESDAWMSDSAVNRYVRLTFTSTAEAQSGVDYSWTMTMPMR